MSNGIHIVKRNGSREPININKIHINHFRINFFTINMIIQNKCSTEQWRKAITIKDISKLMNTSPRIVIGVYLGNTDEALVQLHKRIPKKLKVVK